MTQTAAAVRIRVHSGRPHPKDTQSTLVQDTTGVLAVEESCRLIPVFFVSCARANAGFLAPVCGAYVLDSMQLVGFYL